MNTALKQMKQNLDNLSYENIMEHRFADLSYHKHGEDFGQPTLSCTFTMDIKVWRSYQKEGSLGSIYNCDLSNYLSRKGVLNEYAIPIVNDKARASKGRKTISIEFRLKGHPYNGRGGQ